MFGERLKDQVEERLKFYETGDVPRKNAEVMKAALEEHNAQVKVEKKSKKRRLEETVNGTNSANMIIISPSMPYSYKIIVTNFQFMYVSEGVIGCLPNLVVNAIITSILCKICDAHFVWFMYNNLFGNFAESYVLHNAAI